MKHIAHVQQGVRQDLTNKHYKVSQSRDRCHKPKEISLATVCVRMKIGPVGFSLVMSQGKEGLLPLLAGGQARRKVQRHTGDMSVWHHLHREKCYRCHFTIFWHSSPQIWYPDIHSRKLIQKDLWCWWTMLGSALQVSRMASAFLLSSPTW